MPRQRQKDVRSAQKAKLLESIADQPDACAFADELEDLAGIGDKLQPLLAELLRSRAIEPRWFSFEGTHRLAYRLTSREESIDATYEHERSNALEDVPS